MPARLANLPKILLAPIITPVIVTKADLRRYVVRVTAVCIAVALALDIASQLAFFTNWTTALRSWTLTVVDAVITAVPISLLIGRSQRDLQHAKREVELLSRTDPLTGLPNRRAIMDTVDDEALAIMVLVIVDLDHFKEINDTHGHRIGDTVLRAVAQMLSASMGDAELIGRLGGEEFAVLASADSGEGVIRSLEAFRARMSAVPLLAEGLGIKLTISAGASIRQPGEPFAQLYSEADEALYAAKAAGRNRIAFSPKLRGMWRSVELDSERNAA